MNKDKKRKQLIIRVTPDVHRNLRVLSAYEGRPITRIVHDIIQQADLPKRIKTYISIKNE